MGSPPNVPALNYRRNVSPETARAAEPMLRPRDDGEATSGRDARDVTQAFVVEAAIVASTCPTMLWASLKVIEVPKFAILAPVPDQDAAKSSPCVDGSR